MWLVCKVVTLVVLLGCATAAIYHDKWIVAQILLVMALFPYISVRLDGIRADTEAQDLMPLGRVARLERISDLQTKFDEKQIDLNAAQMAFNAEQVECNMKQGEFNKATAVWFAQWEVNMVAAGKALSAAEEKGMYE